MRSVLFLFGNSTAKYDENVIFLTLHFEEIDARQTIVNVHFLFLEQA